MRLAVLAVAACLCSRPALAADPQPYAVDLAKTGDAAVDAALNDSSTLVSLRENAPVGPFALVARATADRDRLVAALHGLGYYKATVSITVADRALDDAGLPDWLDHAPADPPVKVAIAPTLGPRFAIGALTLTGAVPEDARARLAPLSPGAPAIAADVLAARDRLLTRLREDGYALATVGAPDAVLRPESNTLDVTYAVETGPHVDLGPISLTGLTDVDPDYVRRRLLAHQGDPFSPTGIEKARQDLSNTGVFSTVRAIPASSLDAAGQLPLDFTFAERPPHVVTLDAGYSTDLGITTAATWQHRNLFGEAEQLKLGLQFEGGGTAERDPGYAATAQFIKPDFIERDQSLQADLAAVKESLLAYKRKAITGDILLNRKFDDQWSGSIGVAAENERIEQEGITRYYTLVGLPVTATYNSANSLFDPTEGIRATANVTPTESIGQRDTTFVLLQANASTYLDAGRLWDDPGRSIVALRGLLGDAEGAGQFALPPDKRFYAGGSATVRGYKYQSVGPRFPDTYPEGGTSVTAGTVEFRQRILDSYGVVGFLDAGQVAANGGPFSGRLQTAGGIGARYFTPIGPIRVDVAVPLNKRPGDDTLELYIGIGQSF